MVKKIIGLRFGVGMERRCSVGDPSGRVIVNIRDFLRWKHGKNRQKTLEFPYYYIIMKRVIYNVLVNLNVYFIVSYIMNFYREAKRWNT